MSFKTKHTKEERDDWIEALCFDIREMLSRGADMKAIHFFNERSNLGFLDSIVAVHDYRDRLIELGELQRRGVR